MKLILIAALILHVGVGVAAEHPDSVSKDDLVVSYQEYRQATSEFMAGMTARFEANSFASKRSMEELEADRDRHYRLARPHLDRSIELNPYFAPAYEMRAIVFRDTEKDLLAAISDFSKAIELDPEFETAIEARGELYVKLGRLEEAQKDLALLEARKSSRAVALRSKLERSKQQSEQAAAGDPVKPTN